MVVFSSQNVTKDAPFSRLDLVTLPQPAHLSASGMQKKVLAHPALRAAADRLPDAGDVGDRGRVERLLLARRQQEQDLRQANVVSMAALDFGFGVQTPESRPHPAQRPPAVGQQPGHGGRAEDPRDLRAAGVGHQRGSRHRAHSAAGPALLRADARRAQLQHPAPRRPELHVELRRALHEAKASNERVSLETPADRGRQDTRGRDRGPPVIEPDTKSRCYLVLFHEPKPRRETAGRPSGRRSERIARGRTPSSWSASCW
jgi:hypothetical protein